jgi:hypothetical protein
MCGTATPATLYFFTEKASLGAVTDSEGNNRIGFTMCGYISVVAVFDHFHAPGGRRSLSAQP